MVSLKCDPPPEHVIEWDVATWSRALPLWEAAVGPSLAGKRCLEIGARGGGLSLWMACKGGDVICSYHNVDIAAARDLHLAYKVAEQIRYEAIDATAIPYRQHFDLIMLKSVMGHIGRDRRPERQQEAVHEIHRALKPGGLFLFAENLVSTPLHKVARTYWRPRWRYPTVDELSGMLAAFSAFHYDTAGLLAMFGRSEAQRRMLARIDRALEPRVPAPWRCVIVAAAKK